MIQLLNQQRGNMNIMRGQNGLRPPNPGQNNFQAPAGGLNHQQQQLLLQQLQNSVNGQF